MGESASGTSSLQKGLVEQVMQKHGVTRSWAEELLEEFGGRYRSLDLKRERQ